MFEQMSTKMTAATASATEVVSVTNDRWADQLITLNTFKYVDIDSSRRNRKQYPLASNFVIPYTNASAGYNAFNSLDPVTNAFPYESGITQAPITATMVQLAAGSNPLDNYYINSVLDILGQYTYITNYVGATQTATVYPALAAAPPLDTPYKLRHGIPIVTGTLQAGSTQNTVILPASFDSTDGYYNGNFILLDSGPDAGSSRVIVAYEGATKMATLSTALPFVPGTDAFELDGFSYDNAVPLRYTGSRTLNQAVCYAVQLLQLTIPNITLKVGYGGKINNYPYIYVHFYNDTKHTETIIYGNNPAATLATFRVSVDSVTAAAADQDGPNFFVFDNINLTAPQIMKFSPSESIRFRVTLPNGEDLQFIESDNYSPESPDPFVQISALVGLKQIVTAPKVANSTL
jgi:hypothetical protein